MIQINLLPWRDQQREEKQKQFSAWLILILLSTLLVGALIHGVMVFQIKSQQNRNQRLQQEIRLFDQKLKAIRTFEEDKKRMLARAKIIQDLQSYRPLNGSAIF